MPGGQLSASGGGYDPNVDPGDVNPPAIFEPSTDLSNGTPEIWMAASGGANWGGALVSVSFDGTNYDYVGTITAPAYQGTLTANLPSHADPDTTDTLAIDLTVSAGILPTAATHADADNFRTLVWLTASFSTVAPATGELVTYGAVAATGTYTSNLTYLRRALYTTAAASHAIGSFFTRIDLGAKNTPPNSLLTYDLPPQYIGTTIHVKFQSFNVHGRALQEISGVADYTYTPSGSGYGGGSDGAPTTPAGLAGAAKGPAGYGFNLLGWNANPSADHVSYYEILRRVSGVGSYAPIGTATGTYFIDNTAVSATTYDYELVAVNSVGPSGAAGPVTLTTN